jgi:hypothetical protein
MKQVVFHCGAIANSVKVINSRYHHQDSNCSSGIQFGIDLGSPLIYDPQLYNHNPENPLAE